MAIRHPSDCRLPRIFVIFGIKFGRGFVHFDLINFLMFCTFALFLQDTPTVCFFARFEEVTINNYYHNFRLKFLLKLFILNLL